MPLRRCRHCRPASSIRPGRDSSFRTPSGEAYGFTLNGKIYIDPRIAEADTPIHEYAHLWAEALRISDAKEWNRIRDIILKQFKGSDLFNDVLENYTELQNDPDRLAEEILAHFLGTQGQQRLLDAVNRTDPALPDLRARAIAAVRDTQRAINDFWQRIAQFFGIKDKPPEQIADSILRDLLTPKNSLPFSAGRGSASAHQNVPTRDTFYSNAERAVENFSQKKATAEQWLAMIQKNGGLKAGEDKWLGLSEWLNELKGQFITKKEDAIPKLIFS